MAKFIVVHPVGKDLTLEAATPVAKGVKANVTADAFWLKSYYAREEGKLYCFWDAKDIESIRQVVAKGAPDFPTEGIYELDIIVNPEDFR
ncbi:MAG TPA: DUF4242 domain-containing protein [Dehalococcoidia bacterium]|nr:DUF4242 domain-containing protein [Dehalococcoidia bacterium]